MKVHWTAEVLDTIEAALSAHGALTESEYWQIVGTRLAYLWWAEPAS